MAEAKNVSPRRRVRKTADAKDKPRDEAKAAKKGVVRRFFAAIGRLFRPLKPVFSFLVRILRRITPRYFVNSWREMKKVTWPNRGETWRLTLAVFVFATVFGAMVAIVDRGLDEIFKKVVLK